MTTATAAPAAPSVPSAEQRILLHGVSWQTYEALLREFDCRPIRLTYDRGALEIMTLSHRHEHYSRLLGRLIEALTEELDIPIHSGGCTTFHQEAKQRGLEPDECYWVQNEPRMRGRKEFDFDADPPPDLAIEVDVSRSSLNRLAIYAALGVGEVWRFDGSTLQVYRLQAGEEYALSESSPTFPHLPIAEVLRFLRDSDRLDETSLVRSFRAWARKHVLPRARGKKARAPRMRRPNG
jgi:Uma2 family endonuclease